MLRDEIGHGKFQHDGLERHNSENCPLGNDARSSTEAGMKPRCNIARWRRFSRDRLKRSPHASEADSFRYRDRSGGERRHCLRADCRRSKSRWLATMFINQCWERRSVRAGLFLGAPAGFGYTPWLESPMDNKNSNSLAPVSQGFGRPSGLNPRQDSPPPGKNIRGKVESAAKMTPTMMLAASEELASGGY